MSDHEGDGNAEEHEKYDYSALGRHRFKIEKLMKNIEKPVFIAEQRKPKEGGILAPRENRNVQGSTAGAGSGEFHVYRQLRRREQARQGYMRHQTMVEEADQKFEEKRAAIQAQEEYARAKKRLKRQRKKQGKRKGGKGSGEGEDDDDDDDDEDGADGAGASKRKRSEGGADGRRDDGDDDDGGAVHEQVFTIQRK